MNITKFSEGKHIIDFSATWCNPCKQVAPFFEQYSQQFNTIVFHKIDIDDEPEITNDFGVDILPTFIAIVDGEEIARYSGPNQTILLKLINQLADYSSLN